MVFLVSSAPTNDKKNSTCLGNRFLIAVPSSCPQGSKFTGGKCRTISNRFSADDEVEEKQEEENNGCPPVTTEKSRPGKSPKGKLNNPCSAGYHLVGKQCVFTFVS